MYHNPIDCCKCQAAKTTQALRDAVGLPDVVCAVTTDPPSFDTDFISTRLTATLTFEGWVRLPELTVEDTQQLDVREYGPTLRLELMDQMLEYLARNNYLDLERAKDEAYDRGYTAGFEAGDSREPGS
jgi:hypothetical protein